MTKGHQSFFTYPLTRPLPFRWYTPTVVLGGIIFAVLFTFLNLASSGYNLVLQSTLDPNTTISQDQWLRRWPSYFTSKIKPVCQSVDLPVNGFFFTNQTALSYVLMAVWQQQDGHTALLPSLTYHNNILEDCSVNSIGVEFQSLDQGGNQISYSEWNAIVRTYATCRILNALGTVFFNVTQTYNYVPSTISFSWVNKGFLGTEFLSRDKQAQGSLWWGESLISNYWAYSTRLMQDIRANMTADGRLGIRKGFIYFTPMGPPTDLVNLDFLIPDYRFVVDMGGGNFDVIAPNSAPENATIGQLGQKKVYPNIWIPVDTLAKSAYSTVLADLGQIDKPNILTNTTALEYFTANFTTMQKHMANAEPGPERDPFDAQQRATTGPLRVLPSVISARYLCQVPQLKSTGNLIVAVLVANLVFLQTVWQIFKLCIEAYLVREHPDAMKCKGCAGDLSGHESLELRTFSMGSGHVEGSRNSEVHRHSVDTPSSLLLRPEDGEFGESSRTIHDRETSGRG